MDSRFEIKSIKKSQIHTHMLGLSQKLTKLEIALKTSIALDLGLVPKNWPWNELLFTQFTAKAPPGGHWWNGGLGTNFTNEVLTYLIKKNLIKITLAMANGLEPPARMIIVSANEADKALSGALLTCEWSRFSAFPLTPDPTQPTGQQLNLLFKSRLFPIN